MSRILTLLRSIRVCRHSVRSRFFALQPQTSVWYSNSYTLNGQHATTYINTLSTARSVSTTAWLNKKKKAGGKEIVSEEEEESDDEESGDELDEDYDDGLPKDYTDLIITVKLAPKVDQLLAKGLNTSVNKITDAIASGKVFVNGERIAKRSIELITGDIIDLLKAPNEDYPDLYDVSRLIVLGIDLTGLGAAAKNIRVKVRKWTNMAVDDYKTIDQVIE